jgi:outer membrane protein OmpA-like peptidoglycan-associated protein
MNRLTATLSAIVVSTVLAGCNTTGLTATSAKPKTQMMVEQNEPNTSAEASETATVKQVVLKNANVRSGPTTGSAKISFLKAGQTANITGSVINAGKPWYKVGLKGSKTGFVYAPLIQANLDFIIYFDHEKWAFTDAELKKLNWLAAMLKASTYKSLKISGHSASNEGDRMMALALGDKRSNTVRNYLLKQGVSKSGMMTLTYGRDLPMMLGEHKMAWSMNRRAMIEVK